ncbi:MAG: hypothetical protein EOO54_12000 [Haliea sp.]|nr:MAG: hypothetical protein EOO54_12000 [Haliea sp.]
MSLTLITFALALLAAALCWWRPDEGVGTTVHLLLFIACGFLSGLLLLAGLFTLWWGPARPGLVFWPAVALVLLFVVMAQRDND